MSEYKNVDLPMSSFAKAEHGELIRLTKKLRTAPVKMGLQYGR